MNKKTLLSSLICASLLLVACEKQGPAETVGEKLDNAVNKVEDVVKDRGPMQKAGDRIDDAVSQ